MEEVEPQHQDNGLSIIIENIEFTLIYKVTTYEIGIYEEIDFNKRGSYVNFKGYKDTHSVKKVLSGERKVLVVMFTKKLSII